MIPVFLWILWIPPLNLRNLNSPKICKIKAHGNICWYNLHKCKIYLLIWWLNHTRFQKNMFIIFNTEYWQLLKKSCLSLSNAAKNENKLLAEISFSPKLCLGVKLFYEPVCLSNTLTTSIFLYIFYRYSFSNVVFANVLCCRLSFFFLSVRLSTCLFVSVLFCLFVLSNCLFHNLSISSLLATFCPCFIVESMKSPCLSIYKLRNLKRFCARARKFY